MKWNNLWARQITWKGIDAQGQYTYSSFEGSLRKLKQQLQSNQIALIDYAIRYQIQLKPSPKFLLNFTKDLALLLNSGYVLSKALHLLTKKHHTYTTHAIITTLYTDISKGQTLSHALSQFGNYFPTSYCQLIHAGEQSNQLTVIINSLAKQIAFKLEIRNKIQKAAIYPIATLLFTLFITSGMIGFAIPKFQSIFSNFNATLPHSTQLIVHLSHFIKSHYIYLLLLLILIFIMSVLFYKKTSMGKQIWFFLMFKLPFIKKLLRLKILSTWSSVLSLCLQSKLTLTESLKIANENIPTAYLKKNFNKLPDAIAGGSHLYEALSDNPIMSINEHYLIETGEKSATLNMTLDQIASDATSNIEQLLENLSKWLEPVIMLILAFIAGGLIITMYLPIFQIGTIL